jgi:hypothetical protein
MGHFYTLEITVQRTDVEQKATVYFPLSVGLDISQTLVTQRLRNETSGSSHFLPPVTPSDEGAARVGARRAGTNSTVLIVGRLLFVWDLESHH